MIKGLRRTRSGSGSARDLVSARAAWASFCSQLQGPAWRALWLWRLLAQPQRLLAFAESPQRVRDTRTACLAQAAAADGAAGTASPASEQLLFSFERSQSGAGLRGGAEDDEAGFVRKLSGAGGDLQTVAALGRPGTEFEQEVRRGRLFSSAWWQQ